MAQIWYFLFPKQPRFSPKIWKYLTASLQLQFYFITFSHTNFSGLSGYVHKDRRNTDRDHCCGGQWQGNWKRNCIYFKIMQDNKSILLSEKFWKAFFWAGIFYLLEIWQCLWSKPPDGFVIYHAKNAKMLHAHYWCEYPNTAYVQYLQHPHQPACSTVARTGAAWR